MNLAGEQKNLKTSCTLNARLIKPEEFLNKDDIYDVYDA